MNKWQVNAEDKLNLPADGTVEPPSCIFQNVRETLLVWCKLQNWDGYNHSGIRLHDRGQLYLLAGAGEKLRDNYQELHMMLMKARLTAYQDIFNSNDRGRLTIPEGTQDGLNIMIGGSGDAAAGRIVIVIWIGNTANTNLKPLKD